MHDLATLTPIGGDKPQSTEIKGVTISEMPEFSYASVAMRLGKKAGFLRATKKAMSLAPPTPGKSSSIKVSGGLLTIFWTGVNQWMVEAPYATHEDLAAQLFNTLKDNASITEQNDGWARFDLKGESCIPVIERLSAVDSAKMQAGDSTRTSIEHVGSFLLCRKPPKHFSIICPRSFAKHIYHSLATTAKSAL